MSLNHDGPRGATVTPRVAVLSIVCFWLVYFAVATVRSLMLDFGHQTEMLAARSFVTGGSMVATYIVYLAMRPLAGKSLTVNVRAVALLAIPAAVAYSSMNWMAFREVDRQIELDKQRFAASRRIDIGAEGIAEAREQALNAIADAHDAVREAARQAKAAADAKALAEREASTAKLAFEKKSAELEREIATKNSEIEKEKAHLRTDAQNDWNQDKLAAMRDFEQTRREGGHGLGNMHARAERLGATVRLTSQPGDGTRVVVTLPLQPAPAA